MKISGASGSNAIAARIWSARSIRRAILSIEALAIFRMPELLKAKEGSARSGQLSTSFLTQARQLHRADMTSLGFIKLEIPTAVPEPSTGDGWIHEIKYDGYRTLIVIDQGKVRAYSRTGRDWTGPYRRVVDAAAELPCKAALIDGEMIVQDENGISDFGALRSAIHKAPHR